MSGIELGYGRSLISFEFDEERYQVLSSPQLNEHPLSDLEIGVALDSSIHAVPFHDLLNPGDSVLIVVSDATRATASAQIGNLLVRRLIQNGISPGDIAIIFATGIHRPVTHAEKLTLLTPFIVQRIRTIDHDANDAKSWRLGELPDGTPIEVSRFLRDYSQVIITGSVGFHYFAGFTGGRKSICPGLASAQTIRATHMLALDFEQGGRRAGVGTGQLEGNAVHEACDQVAQLINPSFSVNTIVDDRGLATKVYAGHWRNAHRVACGEYLKSHTVAIDEKKDVVIASCGGLPWDMNLIQAHKALDMAAQACKPGGTIILLAECADGLGRSDFLKWFELANSRSLETFLRENYEVNGQTAWSLLMKAEAYRIILVSALPEESVRKLRVTPAQSLAEAFSMVDSASSGYIMPRGAAFLPVRGRKI
jgi:nickel-dependent lactate racemase